MKNKPRHLIKNAIEKSGLSVSDAAKKLKISRVSLSYLIHGHISITPVMAFKLQKVFNLSAKKLLLMQFEQDFLEAKKNFKF